MPVISRPQGSVHDERTVRTKPTRGIPHKTRATISMTFSKKGALILRGHAVHEMREDCSVISLPTLEPRHVPIHLYIAGINMEPTDVLEISLESMLRSWGHSTSTILLCRKRGGISLF